MMISALHHPRSFVLVGNYGARNIGDEALREYFLTTFSDVDWRAVSADPRSDRELPRLPFGFRSLFTSWWRTVIAIVRSDGIVFGGGSLFTDIESVTACLMWWTYAFVAWCWRKEIVLAFQGIGPFRTRMGKWCARWVVARAAFVSVRDEASLARIASWTKRVAPMLTFDPAFAYFARFTRQASPQRILAIIPRTNSSEAFFHEVRRHSAASLDAVHILLMQPDVEERRAAERILAIIPNATIVEIVSVRQLLAEVGAASHVLTQRFHGALAAMALGIPVTIVPQREGDKLSGLLHADRAREKYLIGIVSAERALASFLSFSF